MNLPIFAFSFGHLRHVDDKLFVRSFRNKFQPHITLFTKYLTLYNN